MFCALSLAAQTDGQGLLEWWMHYQISTADLHQYYEDNLDVKASELVCTDTKADDQPGKGLFTKVARKKGDLIAGFPGYWMETKMFEKTQHVNELYAFNTPKHGGWETVHHLVYATHSCQANFINAAVVNAEVRISIRTHAHLCYAEFCYRKAHDWLVIAICAYNTGDGKAQRLHEVW